jgi:ParB-like chromosome segregation protein Spo0J
MPDMATGVELRATDSLIPYTNNPKEHPEGQVQKIASSIKNYGWDQPIVVDGDGEIIKGHGRLQAAELLGLEEVPVIERTDLSDAEARAARIADNKTAESEWSDDLLAAEVDQLAAADTINFDSLGFGDDELDDLLDNGDGLPEPADETALGLETEYEVIIECESESEQEQVFDELTQEGYECRLNSL